MIRDHDNKDETYGDSVACRYYVKLAVVGTNHDHVSRNVEVFFYNSKSPLVENNLIKKNFEAASNQV